ncbi:MAG: ATP-binding protein [Lachnospiraceae bacterium]|nr:ATP-binding protein [Lachnospiraceae bacterium]
MARTVAIGIQDFEELIEKKYFYIDKTSFIKEWWDGGDSVTLITRPRRFGKTLNMSMVNRFFSNKYADRGEAFEGLSIWEDGSYRMIQGTYPVINLSFANVKEKDYRTARKKICQLLTKLYAQNSFLIDSGILYETDISYFKRVKEDMDDSDAAFALYQLSDFLYRYYGKKVIILLDEYDTPMQEAYVNRYWGEMAAFIRSLFNSSFKTNPWMERGLLTGITRISKESIFSDLNNLKVVTTTSDEYADSFGFTQQEVYAALEECGLGGEKERVRKWYDGFVFGTREDIYNPWSILNFLDTGKYDTYWANTSGNYLIGRLVREGSRWVKMVFERLLCREHLRCAIDEQIVYEQLDDNENAILSLLLASGYLKAVRHGKMDYLDDEKEQMYELALTNYEVERMFGSMVRGWFSRTKADYNDFILALLDGNLEAMNGYMNRVAVGTFSYFDTGNNPSGDGPERFYHGFVLGLLVDLQGKYIITSNRESGFGRYDVMLEPRNPNQDDAILIEFKVHNAVREKSMEDTVKAALRQIEEKKYDAYLLEKGVPPGRIRRYGFAFQGKNVLIG